MENKINNETILEIKLNSKEVKTILRDIDEDILYNSKDNYISLESRKFIIILLKYLIEVKRNET